MDFLHSLLFYLISYILDVHAQDSTATQLNNLVETGTLQWNDGKTRLSNARPLTESLFPNVPPTIHFVSEQAQENLPGLCFKKLNIWRNHKVVMNVMRKTGLKIRKTNTKSCFGTYMALYDDAAFHNDSLRLIEPYQKINQFPDAEVIWYNKGRMWNDLKTQMVRFGKEEFDFVPDTFLWPEEKMDLKEQFSTSAFWITKPVQDFGGNGVEVIDSIDDLPTDSEALISKYIQNPLLINNTKFDLRLHYLITSIDPLIIYIHNGVNVRFASKEYTTSSFDKFRHLTNVKVNKENPQFKHSEFGLDEIKQYFESNNWDWDKLWMQIEDITLKMVITKESNFKDFLENRNNSYNYFQWFGLDILIDDNLKPWFLETNAFPGMGSTSAKVNKMYADMTAEAYNIARCHIPMKFTKSNTLFIKEAFNISLDTPLKYDSRMYSVHLNKNDRRKQLKTLEENKNSVFHDILDNLTPYDVKILIRAEDELKQTVDFKRIFPTKDTHKYLKYFHDLKYSDLLLDSWERKYWNNRGKGIAILENYCKNKAHLQ